MPTPPLQVYSTARIGKRCSPNSSALACTRPRPNSPQPSAPAATNAPRTAPPTTTGPAPRPSPPPAATSSSRSPSCGKDPSSPRYSSAAAASTSNVDDLVAALGVASGNSKSEVSRICAGLDVEVAAFRERTLNHTTFPYIFLDATYCKVRVGAHVVSQAMVVATGVSIDGSREVLGTAVGESESFEFWREFLAGLRARGLTGVHLVISDAHAGLKAAVAQQFTGTAWQRCRVHFMRNLQAAVAKRHVPPVMAAIKTVFAHTRPCRRRSPVGHRRGVDGRALPEGRRDDAVGEGGRVGVRGVPEAHWQKIWSNNPIERLNKEIKRRANVVEIFPNAAAFLRLAMAVVIEQHDEWQVTRRYASDVSMGELRRVIRAKQAAADAPEALTEQPKIA